LLNFLNKKVDKKILKKKIKKTPCGKIFVLKNIFKNAKQVFVLV
jgi:hypothetical protein